MAFRRGIRLITFRAIDGLEWCLDTIDWALCRATGPLLDEDEVDEELDEIEDELDAELELDSRETQIEDLEEELGERILRRPEWLSTGVSGGAVIPAPRAPDRPLAIPFVDSETGDPIVILRGERLQYGPVRQIRIGPDKVPTWASLKVQGLQVTVHGWENRNEEEIPPGKTRLFISKALQQDWTEDGAPIIEVAYSDSPRRKDVARVVAKVLGLDLGEVTDLMVEEALKVPGRKNQKFSVPLFARKFRIDDGANLFGESGWIPMNAMQGAGPNTLQLQKYPVLQHSGRDEDRASMNLVLGPVGDDNDEMDLYCSVSMLVTISSDAVLDPGLKVNMPVLHRTLLDEAEHVPVEL